MPHPNGIREGRRAFASFFIIGVTTVRDVFRLAYVRAEP